MSSVKELVETCGSLSSIPPKYIFPSDSNVIQTISDARELIPTIDFSLLTSATPEQRSSEVQQLGYACREWGFFMVINQSLPQKVIEEMHNVSASFFDLKEEEKGEYRGKHIFDEIKYGTSFNPSKDKSLFWRDHLKVFVHPRFNAPHKPEKFREISKEFCTRGREVSKEVLRGICMSLGLDENYIDKAMDMDVGSQLLVINFYPPCPQPDAATGLPPHTDHGLLTLLTHTQLPGLQIMHHNKWLPVNPPPQSLLFIVADQMEILSNGIYKSVIHRAVVDNKEARISIGIANGPPLDKIVSPAPELVKDTTPLAYKGIKYRDYIELQQTHPLKANSCLDFVRI